METLNNETEIETQPNIDISTEGAKKTIIRTFQKSHSVISSDSGSVRYEHDFDLDDLLPNLQVQNIKLEEDFYISSEDESSNVNVDMEKNRTLNRELKEESKYSMSIKKKQLSFQSSESSLTKQNSISAGTQTSPLKKSPEEFQTETRLRSNSNVMHDDWFFSEAENCKESTLKIQQNNKSKSFDCTNE